MRRQAWLWVLCLPALVQAAPKVEVSYDRELPIYHVGETVQFTIRVTDEGQPITTGKLATRLSNDGVGDLGHQSVELGTAPVVIEGSLDQPGVLQLRVNWQDGDRKAAGLGGAAFDPDQLKADAPPDDFVSWWDSQKALLKATPADLTLREEPKYTNDQHVTYEFTATVLDGGHIRGWYCRPKADGKYPAVLSVPGAGVRPTGPAAYWADKGFLSINLSVHDQPLLETAEFYQELNSGTLNGYYRQGRESRETFYYRRVFLGFVRCIDFLTSQAEWDGKNMVVNGSSQGGGSTLTACGLDPRVTCGVANVPALCYHTGIVHGNASGWPRLIPKPDAQDIITTARYYDAANFAAQIKCPMLVSCGLIDTTCPPTTVYRAYNAIPAQDKAMVPYSNMGHAVPKDWSQRLNEFVQAHLVK